MFRSNRVADLAANHRFASYIMNLLSIALPERDVKFNGKSRCKYSCCCIATKSDDGSLDRADCRQIMSRKNPSHQCRVRLDPRPVHCMHKSADRIRAQATAWRSAPVTSATNSSTGRPFWRVPSRLRRATVPFLHLLIADDQHVGHLHQLRVANLGVHALAAQVGSSAHAGAFKVLGKLHRIVVVGVRDRDDPHLLRAPARPGTRRRSARSGSRPCARACSAARDECRAASPPCPRG